MKPEAIRNFLEAHAAPLPEPEATTDTVYTKVGPYPGTWDDACLRN